MPAQTKTEPPPQNDLVLVRSRRVNGHFSYGILKHGHQADESKTSIRQRNERYSIDVLFRVCVRTCPINTI
jgi:hypothetical protein